MNKKKIIKSYTFKGFDGKKITTWINLSVPIIDSEREYTNC